MKSHDSQRVSTVIVKEIAKSSRTAGCSDLAKTVTFPDGGKVHVVQRSSLERAINGAMKSLRTHG